MDTVAPTITFREKVNPGSIVGLSILFPRSDKSSVTSSRVQANGVYLWASSNYRETLAVKCSCPSFC